VVWSKKCKPPWREDGAKQGFLFDVAPETKALSTIDTLTHRGDPDTSREAARKLMASGRLTGQRRAVFEALRDSDGATHAELGRVMGCDWLVAARRLPELERMGLVMKGQPRICRVKGSRCTTWWLTGREAG